MRSNNQPQQQQQQQSYQGGQRPTNQRQAPQSSYGQQRNYNNQGGQSYNQGNRYPQQQQQQRQGGYGGNSGGFGNKPQQSNYSRQGQSNFQQSSNYNQKDKYDNYKNQRPQTAKEPYPARSNQQKPADALVPAGGLNLVERKVQLETNQFQLKITGEVQVYQYAIEVQPLAFQDTDKIRQYMNKKSREIEMAIGIFVNSGNMIYTINPISDSLRFKFLHNGQQITITIDTTTETTFMLDELQTSKVQMSDHSVIHQLLNILIKQAFRETQLKQIGKAPRFFDTKNVINLQRDQLQIWEGFRASAYQYSGEGNCTLVIDNIFKFMSTTTCLEKIRDIWMREGTTVQKQQRCKLEFVGKTIIANWGNKRTYIVSDVDFTTNPVSKKFQVGEKEISVADYFQNHYGMAIREPRQPLFLIKMGEQMNYLPPEFCIIDGVPDSVRKGAGMRDALAKTRMNPMQKMDRINSMSTTLMMQKSMKEWNISIEPQPVSIEGSILTTPQILHMGNARRCDEQTLRRLPVFKAVPLGHEQWIMCYGKRWYNQANDVYQNLTKACGQLKMNVEEPYWIELDDEKNKQDLEYYLQDYMAQNNFQHPTIVLIVLGNESLYPMYKEVLENYRMPSQVVTTRNAFKFNLSKASNILKQINSKIGGDLYTLEMPKALNPLTMLIGIDVCHAGQQSVVGFSATTNKELTQYYSDYIIQKKYQEIVQDKMKESIEEAIQLFAKGHNGEYPEHFIIFRDGVGDAMREQVLRQEITQFKEVIKSLYNKAKTVPEMTLVVVNKRITQRFFIKDANGKLSNPPSGCIIDHTLVEHDDGDKNFDFFMTPSTTTQGCVLPTHFFVPMNESKLSRKDIQQLTYIMCHLYFNWSGPIKSPAPCMYAHKIAEYYTNTGAFKKRQQAQPTAKEAKVRQIIAQRIMPLNQKLHFL